MDALREISAYLPPGTGQALRKLGETEKITNVRLRAGQPVQAQWSGGEASVGEELTPRLLTQTVSAMLQHSPYAWESELGEGFFTLPGGSRVGVAGKFTRENGRVRLTAVGSLCVRVARAVPGCARELTRILIAGGRVESAVILAPPGAGKTTLLRDAARLISQAGFAVAVSDERGEIAACSGGIPAFDVGPRTDVIDGLNKAAAMARLLRAMAPQVIVADEIGGFKDGQALGEAARMGVGVLATAHAADMADALRRPVLRRLLTDGAFSKAFVVRPTGRIAEVWRFENGWSRQTEGV